MKRLLILVLLVSLYSCNNNPKSAEGQTEEATGEMSMAMSEEIEETEITEDANEAEEEDDCIFDQATQTDEFLKGIAAFEGYTWDQDLHTATIVLENADTLLIQRGGCYSFGTSAEFRLRNDTTDYSETSNVFEKVLWVAKQLEKEFAYQEIKNEIDSAKVSIEKEEGNLNVYFSNQLLQYDNYSIVKREEDGATVITLEYYIN